MTTGLFASRPPTAQGISARNHQRKRRAAHNDRRLDAFAELIAEDMSAEGAAVRLGCAPAYGRVLMARLRKAVGWQAR